MMNEAIELVAQLWVAERILGWICSGIIFVILGAAALYSFYKDVLK